MSSNDVTKSHVCLLWGGWADERDVSHSSAVAVQGALAEAGFNSVDLVDAADPELAAKLSGGDYDVAFIAMHGKYGEDGCIQGLLEVLHIPYTFSGVVASATAADKDLAKLVYRDADIPCPDGMCVARGQEVDADAVVSQLGLPLFVKPVLNGSSYGVTRVVEACQLEDAVAVALESSDRALIEECVTGTEITVPVIGSKDPEALQIVEIVTGAEFYDLKAKYEPSELHHVIPARLAPEVYARAQELAVAAHKALGCSGCSRSDFIVTEDGLPVLLETNTIPGMTERSLLPDSAQRSGIPFPELCRRFVEWALEEGAGRL
ncbi:D-alanine--D-alanine ligase [Atopobiaceae bacterium 24-176]